MNCHDWLMVLLRQVLNNALEGKQYLVNDTFTLADIASYCWVVSAQ